MKKTILLVSALISTFTFANVDTVKRNLEKNYPDIKIDNLQPTEMKGIYSGFMSGQLVYVNDDAQHLLAGTMVRLKDKENLSKNLLIKQNSIDWNALNLNDAVKIVKGSGTRKIVVFSDPNCPYCKNLEEELKKLKDVTIYTFIVPFKPQSIIPSKQVFCEKNPAQAWTDLISKGIQPSSKATCENPIDRNLALARTIGITGTPSIIFSNGFKVSGAYPAEKIEEIFKEFGL
ncbi:thiol:disulfide interchange protein [Acinetobacter sp. ANC 4558]|uniref:DsbC family protein n=1 Tax=Acinetobacter sp. ANC 4558 TaxID=1977876 RepID=UPI000A340666|nr:DsbC family protein [Acinetobacter sp. ANC 4558]OTG79782.1 thiol:disulfide interchange protein [Acinetobacter sp. ANC 4558]